MPLLRDEGEPDDQPVENAADNSRCEVCHLNMANEELTLKHARAGIGCAKRHGESDAHIADESWASGGDGTPPEIMYPRERLASGCMSCHDAEQVFLKAEKHSLASIGVTVTAICDVGDLGARAASKLGIRLAFDD